MQFLYREGDRFVFMDKETYEQLILPRDFLEEQAGYLLAGMEVQINFHKARAIGVQLPPSVVMTVVDTEPGIKKATVTSSFKPATLETGLVVQVPAFVNSGDRIKINTDQGSYLERA